MKNKSIIFAILISITIIIVPIVDVFAYTPLEKIPGITGASFPEYVTGLHRFAIAVVSLAALLMITIGGFSYITSAGNQAQAGTSKKIITDAILGLIVVFISWLVLYTINPDLVNNKAASPNVSGLQNNFQAQTTIQQGRNIQRDVYCKSDGTGCKNSLQECKDAYGDGVCVRKEDVIDKNKTYGVDENTGAVTVYGSKEDCYAAMDEYNCISGREYNGMLVYGIDNLQNEIKLKKTGKVNVMFGANVASLSDKSIEQLKNISGSEYKTFSTATLSGTETHKVGNITITGVNKLGKNGDAKKITVHDARALENYAKYKDGMLTHSKPLVVDSEGNEYYIVKEGEELGGYIISGSANTIILPKDDGSPYTIDELERAGFTDVSPEDVEDIEDDY